jgi:hypothetical protein
MARSVDDRVRGARHEVITEGVEPPAPAGRERGARRNHANLSTHRSEPPSSVGMQRRPNDKLLRIGS